MNQEKIGNFIAECRQEKKMSQTELANKIGVTNKAISKWENGRCLPDVSLFNPLCKELDISVNELLNGAKDPQEDKAIIEYVKYEKKKSKKKIITLTIVSLLLITFILSTEKSVSCAANAPTSALCRRLKYSGKGSHARR